MITITAVNTKSILLLLPVFLWLMTGCDPKTKGTDKTPTLDVSEPVKSVQLIMTSGSTPMMQNIGSIFKQRVQERCEAKVSTSGDAEMKVELLIDSGIGSEGFTIPGGKNGSIQIAGNNQRGLLYGVGKFLRTSAYSKQGYSAGKWRGTSVPEKSVRGMYLANHFNNFYGAAPIEEVERYIEDLAL